MIPTVVRRLRNGVPQPGGVVRDANAVRVRHPATDDLYCRMARKNGYVSDQSRSMGKETFQSTRYTLVANENAQRFRSDAYLDRDKSF
jgi:hypothetical protein